MKERITERPRRPYVKPRIRTIELAAEEVLAVGCKHATGSRNRNQPLCGIGAGCAAAGS